MRLCAVILAASLLLPAFGVSAAPPAEICSVVAGSPPKMITVPTLHVLSLTSSDTFSLPPGAPTNVGAVVCERASLVPAENDYKVLKAGLPFALKEPSGATLWLELQNGQIAVSYKEGALSKSDMSQLQTWVNRVQLFFQTSAAAGSGA
jgi:hypothetical protein